MKLVLGFSTTNGLHSKLIRWFTKANISHVYFRLYDKTFGTEIVLHSDWDGVQIGLLDKFKIDNFVIEEYEIDDIRLDEAVKKNLWHLGKKYHYMKLFNFTWAIIFKRWFIRKMKNPVVNAKKVLCVDFCLYILNDAGIINLPIGFMTPKELKDWIDNNQQMLNWKKNTIK